MLPTEDYRRQIHEGDQYERGLAPRREGDPRRASDPRLTDDPRRASDPRLTDDPRRATDPRLTDDPYREGDKRPWRISKEIPAALVISILFQTAIVIWWASGLTKDVASLDKVANAAYPTREAQLQHQLDEQINAAQNAGIQAISERLKTLESLIVKQVLGHR